jgi:hypothetical protein
MPETGTPIKTHITDTVAERRSQGSEGRNSQAEV